MMASCAAFIAPAPVRPATTASFQPQQIGTVVVDTEAMPVRELDIERRALEAQSRVESARVEFEREKVRNKRQRRKDLLTALKRAKFAKQVKAFGFDPQDTQLLDAYGFDQELQVRAMQSKKSQANFNEATPVWVKKIFK